MVKPKLLQLSTISKLISDFAENCLSFATIAVVAAEQVVIAATDLSPTTSPYRSYHPFHDQTSFL